MIEKTIQDKGSYDQDSRRQFFHEDFPISSLFYRHGFKAGIHAARFDGALSISAFSKLASKE